MSIKSKHKQLKKEVNEVEKLRETDRGLSSWVTSRYLKKRKLEIKDKLYETKQKLHADRAS